MASLNAKAVAMEVIETIGKGKKVNHGEIIRKHGYSKSISISPEKVVNTKSYQSVISQALGKMENVRNKALIALEKRDMTKEKATTLITAVDIMTKNVQLLNGRATDNVAINVEISETIANRYKDMSNSSDNEGKE